MTEHQTHSTSNILQSCALSILVKFISICHKYKLKYYLLSGSALGSVRHSGFIPWDDDIDVGMPRNDYDIFISVAQKELDEFLFLQTYNTDPEYPQNFAKIRNSKTTFIESSVSHLNMNHGIYIDIFPLDGYPSNKMIGRLMHYRLRICRRLIMSKLGLVLGSSASSIFLKIFSHLFSLSKLRKSLDSLMISFEYDKCYIITNWLGVWGPKEAVPKEYFGNGRNALFEGVQVIIPDNYQGYLNSLYGDYMKLPPEGKRISHHQTDIIDSENPYTKYK